MELFANQQQLEELYSRLDRIIYLLSLKESGVHLPHVSSGEGIDYPEEIDRSGYIPKEEQIKRYKDAGVAYDKWLQDTYPGTYDPVTGEPQPQEEFLDPTRSHSFDTLEACQNILDAQERIEYQRSQADAENANKPQQPQSNQEPPPKEEGKSET